ncbi:MAG: hypothetical protein ACJZ2I_01995 [Thalassobaculaceae bacterium]
MTIFHYPMNALRGDYLRGAIGLFVTVGLLVAATKITIFQYIFAAGALLFLGFFLRTAQRHLTTFSFSNDTFQANGPLGKNISLPAVIDIRLRYFSTRKDRTGKGGWFELTIRDPKSKISVDSTINGFEQIMQHCVNTIHQNKLTPSETTIENFSSAGFPLQNRLSSENEITRN